MWSAKSAALNPDEAALIRDRLKTSVDRAEERHRNNEENLQIRVHGVAQVTPSSDNGSNVAKLVRSAKDTWTVINPKTKEATSLGEWIRDSVRRHGADPNIKFDIEPGSGY